MVTSNLRGIIHGKTIELASDPGLQEGLEVEISLRPATGAAGEGLQRAAGALASSWRDEDDEILDQIELDRRRSVSREMPK